MNETILSGGKIDLAQELQRPVRKTKLGNVLK